MKGVGISKDVNKQQTEGPKAATPDCKIPEKKTREAWDVIGTNYSSWVRPLKKIGKLYIQMKEYVIGEDT
jgi:hypothetical protein